MIDNTNPSAPTGITLKAQEDADVRVLSMLNQDALVPVEGIDYDAKAKRFAVLTMRYKWENGASKDPLPLQERVYAGLSFSHVTHVEYKGFDLKTHKAHMLNLLMIEVQSPSHIRLVFSGEAEIKLTHKGPYLIHFQDLSEAWPSVGEPKHGVVNTFSS